MRRRPMPCPHCDAELHGTTLADGDCPRCGRALVAVEIAGLWRRSAAAAVDLAILTVTAGPLAWGLAKLTQAEPLAPGARGLNRLLTIGATDFSTLLLRAGPLLVLVALYFLLTLLFMGRSPGHRLMALRVVDRHGGPPQPTTAVVRTLAQIAGLLPVALGSLWFAFDDERRALHDLVAGTYVVRSS